MGWKANHFKQADFKLSMMQDLNSAQTNFTYFDGSRLYLLALLVQTVISAGTPPLKIKLILSNDGRVRLCC